MESIEVDLLSDQGNDAVLRLPERKHPGVLIQGDSLHSARDLAMEALESIEAGRHPEAHAALKQLAAQLSDACERYEFAMKEHGLPLPY